MTDDVDAAFPDPVAAQIKAAATLMGKTPEEFVTTAVLKRLEALDNVLHEDAIVDSPGDIDYDEWRRRHRHILDHYQGADDGT